MDIKQQLIKEYGEDLIFLLDFDDCIIGVCKQFGRPNVVAYDNDKIISKLAANGLLPQDAMKMWDSQIQAYSHKYAPVFITTHIDKSKSIVINNKDPLDPKKEKVYH